MKLTRRKLRKLIKEELERLSYASKEAGFTYGIEHLPDYYEAEKADDIIGHTWLTHVRKKGSSLNEVGYVLWHSLDESGHIAIYDVEWPDGTIERNIPARLLESTLNAAEQPALQTEHEAHGVKGHELNASINERKYKKKRNYKEDYKKYHSSPQAIADRSARNAARRKMVKAGKVKKGDGKEVNHIKPLSSGGSNADTNLEVISAEENKRDGQKITTKIRNSRKNKRRKY